MNVETTNNLHIAQFLLSLPIMPGAGVVLAVPTDINRIEAPVTFKAYLMCTFAAFAGIFFGFDTGYINGTMAMKYFIHQFTGLPYLAADASASVTTSFVIPAWRQSLIVSILSAGTFAGAVAAGDFADFFGRRTTIIAGCGIFSVTIALQVASSIYGTYIGPPVLLFPFSNCVSSLLLIYSRYYPTSSIHSFYLPKYLN